MITLSSNVQSERRDCIVTCPDLQIAIRANGEEETKMIDIAGNMYPAGIPVPTVAPGLSAGSTDPSRLANGYYAYTYVYAAKNRYPYLDAGKAMQGSIAPRGNPAPYAIFQVIGGPRRVVVNVTGSTRLDIDQIIIYRSVAWATQADAEIAAKAGQMYSIGLVTNVLPNQNYNDDAVIPTANEQVEYDNQFAPTVMLATYEAPYVWAIGNDVLIKSVSWAGNTITLQDEGKWFEGRNGQLVTVSGITSGGTDGRGTFIFKAGDASGNNINTAAILTKDGVTPEVLSPAIGSGFIRIAGPTTSLYRSKPRNPLAWGETTFIGVNQRFAQLFARRISGGRATAIGVIPGGEYLKIDVKDPSKCYTFSLRAAGTPAFESSRREISSMSVSHHFSQFIASSADGQKVLWGWDADNHAILECDGNTQRIISQDVFETLREMQTETSRAQYVQGFCNEELELNILLMPWGESINSNDLAVYQHYPSGKWATALVGDLISTCSVRDPLTNLLRYLGGRDSGFIVEHQMSTTYWNHVSGVFNILSWSDVNKTLNTTPGFLQEHTGLWGLWFSNETQIIKIGRILAVNTDTVLNESVLEFDRVLTIGTNSQSYNDVVSLAANSKFLIGQIPCLFEKVIELGSPTILKVLEGVSISGDVEPLDLGTGLNYGVVRLYIYAPDTEIAERLPKTILDPHFDDVTPNQGIYRFNQVAVNQHGKIRLQIAPLFFDSIQMRTLNLDIR